MGHPVVLLPCHGPLSSLLLQAVPTDLSQGLTLPWPMLSASGALRGLRLIVPPEVPRPCHTAPPALYSINRHCSCPQIPRMPRAPLPAPIPQDDRGLTARPPRVSGRPLPPVRVGAGACGARGGRGCSARRAGRTGPGALPQHGSAGMRPERRSPCRPARPGSRGTAAAPAGPARGRQSPAGAAARPPRRTRGRAVRGSAALGSVGRSR